MRKNLIFDLRVTECHLRVLDQVVHSCENEHSAYLVEDRICVGKSAPRVQNMTIEQV